FQFHSQTEAAFPPSTAFAVLRSPPPLGASSVSLVTLTFPSLLPQTTHFHLF
ncbi:hypothetical protein S245_049909, partial [Arachis hypogaea]